jgi:hypothetical protein
LSSNPSAKKKKNTPEIWKRYFKKQALSWVPVAHAVILATQEAQKSRADGVAQGVGLEFKPQHHRHTHKKALEIF